jgi:hypothetical protein
MDYVQRVRQERRCFPACLTCPCIGRQLIDGSLMDSSLWTIEQQLIDQLLALTTLSQPQRRLVPAVVEKGYLGTYTTAPTQTRQARQARWTR